MTDNEIIFATFEQAAESLGDITPMVYEDLFGRHPEAEQYFLIKGEEYKQDLEKKMVEDAIYSFLEYLENPEEVEIEFKYTIPQHQDLGIPLDLFSALLQSVANVVCNTVEEDREQAQSSWNGLVNNFRALVDRHTRKN
jgi:hemoglobin-like flavoprotein